MFADAEEHTVVCSCSVVPAILMVAKPVKQLYF